jgi:hypothetical protein
MTNVLEQLRNLAGPNWTDFNAFEAWELVKTLDESPSDQEVARDYCHQHFGLKGMGPNLSDEACRWSRIKDFQDLAEEEKRWLYILLEYPERVRDAEEGLIVRDINENHLQRHDAYSDVHRRWETTVDRVLDLANELLQGHGVEAIQDERAHVDSYYFNIIGLYVNMGDTYNQTVVYDTDEQVFQVTDWGDFYDCWAQEQEEQEEGEDE